MNALRTFPGRTWTRFTGWLSGRKHATVGFSLLRILFGLAMLITLIPSFADREYLWGAGSWWVEPEARRRGWWEIFRGVFSKTDSTLFDLAFLALLLLVGLFLIGFMTRFVTPVLLLFWVGLSTNTNLLTNGGDTLIRIVLFFAIFASLSEHFSVDAWMRRRRVAKGRPASLRPRWIPEWVENWAHNTALILCCYQILLVYLVSSVLKLQGQDWLNGTGLYYALSLDEFRVFPWLSDAVSTFGPIVNIGTYMALGVQLLFPLALLWKPSRYVFVALITFTHLGIAVLLGLWPFSLAMIAVDMLLVRDGSWERVAVLVRRLADRVITRMRTATRSATASGPGAVRPGPVGVEPATRSALVPARAATPKI